MYADRRAIARRTAWRDDAATRDKLLPLVDADKLGADLLSLCIAPMRVSRAARVLQIGPSIIVSWPMSPEHRRAPAERGLDAGAPLLGTRLSIFLFRFQLANQLLVLFISRSKAA